jgi:hypothetical protein
LSFGLVATVRRIMALGSIRFDEFRQFLVVQPIKQRTSDGRAKGWKPICNFESGQKDPREARAR